MTKALLMKPLKTRPKLLELIKRSIATYDAMTPKQKEELHKKQAESWARQDMD